MNTSVSFVRVQLLFLFIVVGTWSSAARAQTLPHTFTAGTPASAAEVNANFAYLLARIVPTGAVMPFAGSTAPAGWLLCDGSEVSRTTYPELFALIGVDYGIGDSVTTFNLPDYRGRFLRGVDGTAGNDPDKASRTSMNTGGNTGNAVGSSQVNAFASHTHTVVASCTNFWPGDASAFMPTQGYLGTKQTYASGGNETRPKNAYVNWIIKY